MISDCHNGCRQQLHMLLGWHQQRDAEQKQRLPVSIEEWQKLRMLLDWYQQRHTEQKQGFPASIEGMYCCGNHFCKAIRMSAAIESHLD